MKTLLVAALFCLTGVAHAHQYIQCASATDLESTNRTVINLAGKKSTLFMTTGLQDPEEQRILKSIKYIGTNGKNTIYQAQDDFSIETIAIPTALIGKSSNNFFLGLELRRVDGSIVIAEELQCFSAIYDNN